MCIVQKENYTKSSIKWELSQMSFILKILMKSMKRKESLVIAVVVVDTPLIVATQKNILVGDFFE